MVDMYNIKKKLNLQHLENLGLEVFVTIFSFAGFVGCMFWALWGGR